MSDNHDVKEIQKLELPPMPEPLLEIPDDAKEFIRFKGDPTDMGMRLRHKLILMWILYGFSRNDEKLIEIVNQSHEKDSDLWYVCNKLINILDQWARLLTTTDIVEELSGKSLEEEEKLS